MKTIPVIIVQLIHIEGPLKGEIQEFTDFEITMGRDFTCHVQFPKELNYISRQHAKIVREGNRFKLMDVSTNGTLVNGKPIDQAFLNDGDVIFFTEKGPKLSFLKEISSETMEAPFLMPLDTTPPKIQDQEAEVRQKIPTQQTDLPRDKQLVVQYGLGIMSFNRFPIVIGKHPECDFKVQDQDLFDRHAEIEIFNNGYIVNDLTGKDMVKVDEMAAHKTKLEIGSVLKLLPGGLFFKYVDEGRLMEIDNQEYQSELADNETDTKNQPCVGDEKMGKKEIGKPRKSIFSLFKKS